MTAKHDLIKLRDETKDAELKTKLRAAINRIEDLECDVREIEALTKSIQRIIRTLNS